MKATGRLYAPGRGVEKDSPTRCTASTTLYNELTVFRVQFDCYVVRHNIHLITGLKGNKKQKVSSKSFSNFNIQNCYFYFAPTKG